MNKVANHKLKTTKNKLDKIICTNEKHFSLIGKSSYKKEKHIAILTIKRGIQ